ncbi:MAG: asparagine synthase-related protein, partial [Flavobacterium sp.]|nr:asparagine synthase-related protein [Flavobacterium sp.]
MNSFKNYTSLGFNNPYYTHEDKLNFENSFSEILRNFQGDLKVDLTAVNQILCLNFMLGNRTLIKNIYKSPWMAKPNENQTKFDFYKIQKHEELLCDELAIAQKFYTLLREEVKSYVGTSKRIGILLSGGMDSRMVAGILNDLILDQEIAVESITGYTWGNLDSRDVVYSERICKKLGWNFKHYLVTAEDLWNNMKIASLNGCEYSGLHLHAIPQILNDLDVQVMLAGSFGDSIGRAEYSGKKVVELKSLLKRRKNFAYLLDYKTYTQTKQDWMEDLNYYHQKFPEAKNYQQLELDYQLHYMRRML